MSETKEKEKPYYCKWCDSLVNALVEEKKNGLSTWEGCINCYLKLKELQKDATKKK